MSQPHGHADAPYLDPGHSADERTADLLGRMTVEEKAGLMFHPMALVSPGGELAGTFALSQFLQPRTRWSRGG